MLNEFSIPRAASVVIVLATLALMGVGVLAIHATEQASGDSGFAQKQLVYAAVAIGAFAVCALVPFARIGHAAYVLFGITLVLLLLMYLLPRYAYTGPIRTLLPEVRGAYRWINLGFTQAQPSEFAKLTFIILLAWYLRTGDHYRTLRGLVPPFVLTFVPMALILVQPDLGTALLFLPTLYFMLFMAGAKLRHLLGIVAIATVLVFVPIPQKAANMDSAQADERRATAYFTVGDGDDEVIVSAASLAFMKYHQLQRIDGWLRQGDPAVIQNIGYQLHHSKIVLGSGKGTGREGWEAANFYYRRLSDDHTDFIFAVIGGQWGFVGCAGVMLLYGVIVLMGVEIAATTVDPFGRLLAVGVIGLLVSQLMINVGMTMGLMPITGMTLPFISYGGSSLLTNCAAMGLLVNVAQRRPVRFNRRPFEHKDDTSPAPYRPLETPTDAPR